MWHRLIYHGNHRRTFRANGWDISHHCLRIGRKLCAIVQTCAVGDYMVQALETIDKE